jgi:hypothetical protein
VNVASLDICDGDEFFSAVQPQSAGALSHVWLELHRRGYIPAALGFHGHTSTWLLHGSGEQSSYSILGDSPDRFLCTILRVYVPTLHSLCEIKSE